MRRGAIHGPGSKHSVSSRKTPEFGEKLALRQLPLLINDLSQVLGCWGSQVSRGSDLTLPLGCSKGRSLSCPLSEEQVGGVWSPTLLPPPGGLLWLRELHRGHRWQRAHELPFQRGDGDDPGGIHDVRGRGVPHDDPAVQTGSEHPALRAAGKIPGLPPCET